MKSVASLCLNGEPPGDIIIIKQTAEPGAGIAMVPPRGCSETGVIYQNRTYYL